jgi:hypothetical protein
MQLTPQQQFGPYLRDAILTDFMMLSKRANM